MQLTIDKFSELNKIKEEFTETMGDMREELTDHLDAINQNSLEIQANYDYLEELSQKIDKINNKLDELYSIVLKGQNTQQSSIIFPAKTELSPKEKEIFLVLYTSTEPLSHEEIAARADYPIYLVEDIVEALERKKIPLVRKYFAGKSLLLLDEDFKKMQNQTGMIKVRS